VEPIILDGDELRECLNARDLYTFHDRLELARTYSRLANLLVQQHQLVIVATMSLFHEVHQMNRQTAFPYFEVFLDLPMSILRQRDFKGLYGTASTPAIENVGGLDLDLEVPLEPHLHITDPEIDPESLASMVFHRFMGLYSPTR